MTLESILNELKEKRRMLDKAITTLELLKQKRRRKGARSDPGKTRSSGLARSKRGIADTATIAAAGADYGELIPFPSTGRRARSGRDSG